LLCCLVFDVVSFVSAFFFFFFFIIEVNL